MHADRQIIMLMALTSGAGWLMLEAGVFKNLLEPRRERSICPSCGRSVPTWGCF